MQLTVIGINHKTAPVETREQLAFSHKQVQDFVSGLVGKSGLREISILSTCNRTEIHYVSRDHETALDQVIKELADFCGLSFEDFENHLYTITDQQAVHHIFCVTAGLNSLVIGETEILGQVKTAYQLSDEAGGIDSILHGLYQQAIKAGKRVHNETGINDNAASVSYASVELANNIFDGLQNTRALLIGAGKMSELTAKHLYSNGVKEVVVINRTLERAKNIAEKFGGLYAPYSQLDQWLKEVDIVISSTGAPHFVIDSEHVERALEHRSRRPMFLIDIAVPRDIKSDVNDLDNAHLYTIDDLEAVVESNMKAREEDAREAQRIISEEVTEFMVWYKTRDVVPLISALREKAENIRNMELEKYQTKLSKLSEKDRKTVDKLTKSLINRILKEPVLRIKEFAVEDQSELYVATLAHLFDLDEHVIPEEYNKKSGGDSENSAEVVNYKSSNTSEELESNSDVSFKTNQKENQRRYNSG